ncbi:hypothetical protein [Erwinia sp. 198]|uniref:hypothetical protein n=1 Tax=Erwinia sp. 198 TaxID=2022746 RepID=UPI000F6783A4|nr:hypothetical protein [Erwinia sp. 198]RRZ95557.1 hypothetical protein EGK14_03050 [Erwinia sp. 198]
MISTIHCGTFILANEYCAATVSAVTHDFPGWNVLSFASEQRTVSLFALRCGGRDFVLVNFLMCSNGRKSLSVNHYRQADEKFEPDVSKCAF